MTEDSNKLQSRLEAIKKAQRGKTSSILPSFTTHALSVGKRVSNIEYNISFRSGFYINHTQGSNNNIAVIENAEEGTYLCFRVALAQGIDPSKLPPPPPKKGFLSRLFSTDPPTEASQLDSTDPSLQIFDVVEVGIPLAINSDGHFIKDEARPILPVRLYDDFSYQFALSRIIEFANPSFPICSSEQGLYERFRENDAAVLKFINEIDLNIDGLLPEKTFSLNHVTEIDAIEDFMRKRSLGFDDRYEVIQLSQADFSTNKYRPFFTIDTVCRNCKADMTTKKFPPLPISNLMPVQILPDVKSASHNPNDMALVLFEEIKQNLILQNYKFSDQVIAPNNERSQEELLKASFSLKNSRGLAKLSILITQLSSGEVSLAITQSPDPWGRVGKNLSENQRRELSQGKRYRLKTVDFLDDEKRTEFLRDVLITAASFHEVLTIRVKLDLSNVPLPK